MAFLLPFSLLLTWKNNSMQWFMIFLRSFPVYMMGAGPAGAGAKAGASVLLDAGVSFGPASLLDLLYLTEHGEAKLDIKFMQEREFDAISAILSD